MLEFLAGSGLSSFGALRVQGLGFRDGKPRGSMHTATMESVVEMLFRDQMP